MEGQTITPPSFSLIEISPSKPHSITLLAKRQWSGWRNYNHIKLNELNRRKDVLELLESTPPDGHHDITSEDKIGLLIDLRTISKEEAAMIRFGATP